MPKVVELYKEVKKLVKVKSFTGADAEKKAAEYLNCSTELIRNVENADKRICGGHYVKKRVVEDVLQRKLHEKQLAKRAQALLFRHQKELDLIKGKILEEYGIDHELFESNTQAKVPVIARQAFCYLAFQHLKKSIGISLSYAIIGAYLYKHRTTVMHSIDTVLDGLEMPLSDYQWIKKVKL